MHWLYLHRLPRCDYSNQRSATLSLVDSPLAPPRTGSSMDVALSPPRFSSLGVRWQGSRASVQSRPGLCAPVPCVRGVRGRGCSSCGPRLARGLDPLDLASTLEQDSLPQLAGSPSYATVLEYICSHSLLTTHSRSNRTERATTATRAQKLPPPLLSARSLASRRGTPSRSLSLEQPLTRTAPATRTPVTASTPRRNATRLGTATSNSHNRLFPIETKARQAGGCVRISIVV